MSLKRACALQLLFVPKNPLKQVFPNIIHDFQLDYGHFFQGRMAENEDTLEAERQKSTN